MINRSGKKLAPSLEAEGTSRRQFLRRAGVAGALTAAMIGGAEVTGLSSALCVTARPERHSGRISAAAASQISASSAPISFIPTSS